MRLLAGIVLALASAAPAAAADTIARGDVTAGPVIAGDGIAWADRTASGAVRVLSMAPGGRPAVRRRWAAPRHARTIHWIRGVSAGGSRAAAVVDTCTRGRGPIYERCAPRAFAGPLGRLRGPRLPAKVGTRCPRGARNAAEAAAGGRWTAVLVERFCQLGGIESSLAGRRIEARSGARRRTIPVAYASGLRLAGDHLAWMDGRGGAVLYDLRRGERVRRIGDARGRVGAIDVQADGTLALTRYAPAGEVCVSTVALGGVERQVACRFDSLGGDAQTGGSGGGGAEPAVAISGGRVLYLRHAAELVLQRPGGEPDVVARFTPTLGLVGGFDLGPGHATWAQQRRRFPPGSDGMPRGPESVGKPQVVLRSL